MKTVLTAALSLGFVATAAQASFIPDTAGNFDITSADAITLPADNATVELLALSAPGDVDFYSIELEAGDILTVITTLLDSAAFMDDTTLGVHDVADLGDFADFGTIDEDSASVGSGINPKGSAVQVVADADGTYYIGVTAFGDFDFDGDINGAAHNDTGLYILTVSVIPSGEIPAPGAFALAGAAGLVASRRRRA